MAPFVRCPNAFTFSRAFQEFVATALPSRIHEALIKKGCPVHLVEHISRDSTAIEAREKAVPKKKKPALVARKRGCRIGGKNVQRSQPSGTPAYDAPGGDVGRFAKRLRGIVQAHREGI